MPDAAGNIKGIALSGKAGEVLDRIKQSERRSQRQCEWCEEPATHEIAGMYACQDCWEKAYNLD